MGGSLEKALFDNQVSWMPTEDPTFVIPSTIKLTPAQLEILNSQNVRPGMAFSLTNEGTIEPPNSKKFKLKMVKSFVSILADTLALTEMSRGKFSVGFTYSSTMAVSCTINFNVRDHTTSSKVDVKQALISWGPFSLPAGLNVTWSTTSLSDSYLIDYTKLPIYVHYGKPSPNYYDVVICFEPFKSNSWAPTTSLSLVKQFGPVGNAVSSKKVSNSGPKTLYAKSFLFSQRNKVGLEDPPTAPSQGFDVVVGGGDPSTVAISSAAAGPLESPAYDQRFAKDELDVSSHSKIVSTPVPTTAVVETSDSGTIIQSVVYYYRLPYHSGGRYLETDPAMDGLGPTALKKGGKKGKKPPPSASAGAKNAAGQRGVNVFPVFAKTNRAVVIPQNDPDELPHEDGPRGLDGHYQPLEEHEVDGMVSKFLADFSDDSDHGDKKESKPTRGSGGGGVSSNRGGVGGVNELEESAEDYSMYESPSKPQYIGGVQVPPMKISTESPARGGSGGVNSGRRASSGNAKNRQQDPAETSTSGRMEIRPTDVSPTVPAPLTGQSVSSSAAMSVASERSLEGGGATTGGGVVSSDGRTLKGGNFSPDASGTSYDFSAGGGSDSPAMFNKATFVSAIKKDATALPGGKHASKGAVASGGVGGGEVSEELFTSAPMVAQCVHQRFKTVGGVYNAMPMFGMESYYGKGSEPTEEGGGDGASPSASPPPAPASAIDPDDCIICLENPRDTAMFPCRHLCVCSGCAAMSMGSESKCPMCRNSVTIMLQFKKRRTVNL